MSLPEGIAAIRINSVSRLYKSIHSLVVAIAKNNAR